MKKLIALLLILINVLYIVLLVMRAIYSHSQVIIDYSKYNPVALPHNFLWDTLPTLLSLCIYIGMAAILAMFREKFWITLGPIIFGLQLLATTVVRNRIYNATSHADASVYRAIRNLNSTLAIGNLFTMLYLIVVVLMVRNLYTRPYFRAYVFAIALSILLAFFNGFMYALAPTHELRLNQNLMGDICYIATLALFIRVFLLLLKDEPPVEAVS